jgi:hypothetical protein
LGQDGKTKGGERMKANLSSDWDLYNNIFPVVLIYD